MNITETYSHTKSLKINKSYLTTLCLKKIKSLKFSDVSLVNYGWDVYQNNYVPRHLHTNRRYI